ncbi:TolC family protein [Sphingomonas jaspsi]|uniref:TolC family protein n=1 Tax=Sphingomonas jaspsi TaxID=392409 RepID=UPI0004BBEDEA|nr:TolC family protein [Sphingomonas jaspsi]
MGKRPIILLMAGAMGWSTPALAEQPVAISWSAADLRFTKSSAEARAAEHQAAAADLTAQSLATLRRPNIDLSAQLVRYQKTLSVDVSSLKDQTQGNLDAYLGGLPGQFPADLQGIVQQVTDRIEQALPGLLLPIPDTLKYQARETLFRPTITAFMPLYTGGAIPALQKGAGAAAVAARAKADADVNLARVNLARAYFGQTLAEGLERTAESSLAAMDRHLFNADAFYRNGVLPKARVLEVQVARDAAARNLERARIDRQRADDALQRILEMDAPVEAATPMFVHSKPLLPVADYVASATGGSPRVKEAEATAKVAKAGVGLTRSRLLPQAYAFGEYSLDRKSAAPTEPDWIAGIGVRWTLLSSVDRRKALAAAKERENAARDGTEVAKKLVATEVSDAWALAETARRSFLSLESSTAAAQENLRVAEIAFREGEGTAASVIDARAALTAVETQRLAAAYEYDVALAALMAASGRMQDYDAAVATADRRIGG